MNWEIKNAPASIRKGEWGTAVQQPRGDNARPVKASETKLTIKIDVSELAAKGDLDWLQPGLAKLIDETIDVEAPGFDLMPRANVPDLTVVVSVKGEEVFRQTHCPIVGKIHIGMKSKRGDVDIYMMLRPLAKLTKEETTKLQELANADVYVSFFATQVDLAETVPLVQAPVSIVRPGKVITTAATA